MASSKREINEKKFSFWEENDLGRLYWFEIDGKFGWKARYLKQVDKDDITIKFWQEIYNNLGILEEIHEKYPEDKGHVKLNKDDY
ncbi:MAG: hypothetical protein IE931_10745 [Sphingobacteriales bacterium]|nr:hypothetical protein [Sphingobacteriales bacterium]